MFQEDSGSDYVREYVNPPETPSNSSDYKLSRIFCAPEGVT